LRFFLGIQKALRFRQGFLFEYQSYLFKLLLILLKTLPIIGPRKVSTAITTTATKTSIKAYSTTILVNLQVIFPCSSDYTFTLLGYSVPSRYAFPLWAWFGLCVSAFNRIHGMLQFRLLEKGANGLTLEPFLFYKLTFLYSSLHVSQRTIDFIVVQSTPYFFASLA